ncbi:MAG: hypothetical protein ACREJB_09640, partial [Planctomycetaceae bacterium]
MRNQDQLKAVAEQYQREGYEVVLEPREADRPGFLRSYSLD